VALRYVESWLRGTGAAALDNLMEDAATAEIARSQLWQWIQQGTVTSEGTAVTRPWVEELLRDVLGATPRSPRDRFDDAAAILREVALGEDFPAFLTLSGYSRYLVAS